ncbi:hypothetical protein L484_007432 [Morus notabilis]|uniref:Uncharacterized protein n=1 Tax=Morus notabilis TaxID=981085 RepID=W9QZN3_9ROSA|nr:hypothetical protein L484_007432 [Morus notabilis]
MFDWRSGGCYLLVLCALVFLVWKLREKPGKLFRLLKGYFPRFVDVKFAHHMVDDDQGVNIWMTTRESTLVDNHAQDGMAMHMVKLTVLLMLLTNCLVRSLVC